jgi:hypothetical protein
MIEFRCETKEVETSEGIRQGMIMEARQDGGPWEPVPPASIQLCASVAQMSTQMGVVVVQRPLEAAVDIPVDNLPEAAAATPIGS